MCVSLQDYNNALRVVVKGQATLKLITDKPTIKMERKTTEVGDSHLTSLRWCCAYSGMFKVDRHGS